MGWGYVYMCVYTYIPVITPRSKVKLNLISIIHIILNILSIIVRIIYSDETTAKGHPLHTCP